MGKKGFLLSVSLSVHSSLLASLHDLLLNGSLPFRRHTHTHGYRLSRCHRLCTLLHFATGGSHRASYSSRSTCSSSQRSSVRAFCRSESLRCICCVASGARKKGSGELSQSMPQHGHGHTVTGFTNRKEDVPPHPPWSAAASAPAPRPPSAPPCSQQPHQQSHQRQQQQQGPARHPLPRLVLVPVLLPLLRPHCWRWRCVGAGPRRQSRRGRPGPSPARSAPRATPPLCHVCLGWGGDASSVAAVDIKKGQLPAFLSSSPLGQADQTHKHAHQHQPFPPCARLALVRICSRSAPASACFRLWISLFTGWRGCVWVSQQKSPTRTQASSTYETIALNLGCGRGLMVSV